MRFKVLAGRHVDENRQMYKKGDVVQTEHDLVKMFGGNKFRKLADQDPNVEAEEPLSRQAGMAKAAKHESRKPLTSKEKEMVRRKVQSNEQEPGQEDGEEEQDETQVQAEGEAEETNEDSDEERVQGVEDEAADQDDTEDRGELGKDVTTEFEDFKTAKLKVWRDGNQFNVTTRKDPEKALNKVVLKKTELKKFLKTHLKDKGE
jgi:hypothetical protein